MSDHRVVAMNEPIGTIRYTRVAEVICKPGVAIIVSLTEDVPPIGHLNVIHENDDVPAVGERVRLTVVEEAGIRFWNLTRDPQS